MKHKDLVSLLAVQNSLSEDKVDNLLRSLSQVVKEHVLAQGKTLQIKSMGSLSRRDRPVRNARNPRSGEVFECAASSNVIFAPAACLRTKHT